MSYEVTATRRRPQSFDALAGQEFVAETLKNSIAADKIAHAYLFSGPRGCGKTSTARILAKALNCENGPTSSPCGKCQHCLEITRGQSTDVIEIDGASNTSVNDIRQIKDEVLFPPQSARYKIYIIDEVHMLSTSAFNALLKTIEEPPAYCIFIFATTELHKVPATIKSRCQQFNFRLVPIEKVKEELKEAAAEIGIEADDEALYWVARESTGSMRDAYTLFDQVAAFSGAHLTYEKIRDKLGLVGIESLNAIFEEAAQNKTQETLLKIDEFLQNGISIEQFVTNCTEYLRSILLIKAGISKESLLGHPKERFSETVIKLWNPVQVERALSILLQLFRDIRYSLSPRYELELAFSRLSWLTQYVSPAEVKRAIDEAKSLLLNGNVNAPQVSAAPQRVFIQAPQTSQAVTAQTFDALPKAEQPAKQNPYIGRTVTLEHLQGESQAPSTSAQPPAQSEPASVSSFSRGGAEPPEQTVKADISSPDFREKILKELLLHEPLLATLLNQTGEWTKTGGTVSASVQTSYLKMQLSSNLKKISTVLSNFFGENISFQVVLEQQKTEDTVQAMPAHIKMLCDVFRGQVVGHSRKTEQEIQQAKKEKAEKAAAAEDSDEKDISTHENLTSDEDNNNDE